MTVVSLCNMAHTKFRDCIQTIHFKKANYVQKTANSSSNAVHIDQFTSSLRQQL